MESFQNNSETSDRSTKKPKESFFKIAVTIIALILIIGCVGGFLIYRYFISDYLFYDRPSVTLKAHRSAVASVLFSPNGQTIASGSYDKTVKLWDAANGNLKQTLSGHTDHVNAFAFSPDGRTIASGSNDKTIRLHDAESGKLLYEKSFEFDVVSLSFSPDGQRLFVASSPIHVLDSANGDIRYSIPTNKFYAVALAISPDGKTLAGTVRNEVKLWDAENGNLRQSLGETPDAARPLVFSPDGQTLVGGSFSGKIFVWEIATGKLKKTVIANSDKVPIAISPDGKTLASGGVERSKDTDSFDGEIEFWDLANGNLMRKFAKQRAMVTSLAFSPNGRTLAAGNIDGTIGLWNLE